MKTVCVIGLGPAGLTSVKELRAHGLDVTAYDPSSKIGGRWSLDWSTFKHGVWKEMCLNDPRTFIEFGRRRSLKERKVWVKICMVCLRMPLRLYLSASICG